MQLFSSSSALSDKPADPPSFLADRMRGFDAPSVWSEFSPLAAKEGAVAMGQVTN